MALIFPNRFKTINEDAIFGVDFDHSLNQELVIKPGEESAEISVNVTEDNFLENNETFLLTLMSLDKVTIVPTGSARITILNNGKTYMPMVRSYIAIVIENNKEKGFCQGAYTICTYNNNLSKKEF